MGHTDVLQYHCFQALCRALRHQDPGPQRPITPLIADYTRKSISAFIEKYPNVGLLVALGEAMSGKENDVKWFTETIIPGVKDGLKALAEPMSRPLFSGHTTPMPLWLWSMPCLCTKPVYHT